MLFGLEKDTYVCISYGLLKQRKSKIKFFIESATFEIDKLFENKNG